MASEDEAAAAALTRAHVIQMLDSLYAGLTRYFVKPLKYLAAEAHCKYHITDTIAEQFAILPEELKTLIADRRKHMAKRDSPLGPPVKKHHRDDDQILFHDFNYATTFGYYNDVFPQFTPLLFEIFTCSRSAEVTWRAQHMAAALICARLTLQEEYSNPDLIFLEDHAQKLIEAKLAEEELPLAMSHRATGILARLLLVPWKPRIGIDSIIATLLVRYATDEMENHSIVLCGQIVLAYDTMWPEEPLHLATAADPNRVVNVTAIRVLEDHIMRIATRHARPDVKDACFQCLADISDSRLGNAEREGIENFVTMHTGMNPTTAAFYRLVAACERASFREMGQEYFWDVEDRHTVIANALSHTPNGEEDRRDYFLSAATLCRTMLKAVTDDGTHIFEPDFRWIDALANVVITEDDHTQRTFQLPASLEESNQPGPQALPFTPHTSSTASIAVQLLHVIRKMRGNTGDEVRHEGAEDCTEIDVLIDDYVGSWRASHSVLQRLYSLEYTQRNLNCRVSYMYGTLINVGPRARLSVVTSALHTVAEALLTRPNTYNPARALKDDPPWWDTICLDAMAVLSKTDAPRCVTAAVRALAAISAEATLSGHPIMDDALPSILARHEARLRLAPLPVIAQESFLWKALWGVKPVHYRNQVGKPACLTAILDEQISRADVIHAALARMRDTYLRAIEVVDPITQPLVLQRAFEYLLNLFKYDSRKGVDMQRPPLFDIQPALVSMMCSALSRRSPSGSSGGTDSNEAMSMLFEVLNVAAERGLFADEMIAGVVHMIIETQREKPLPAKIYLELYILLGKILSRTTETDFPVSRLPECLLPILRKNSTRVAPLIVELGKRDLIPRLGSIVKNLAMQVASDLTSTVHSKVLTKEASVNITVTALGYLILDAGGSGVLEHNLEVVTKKMLSGAEKGVIIRAILFDYTRRGVHDVLYPELVTLVHGFLPRMGEVQTLDAALVEDVIRFLESIAAWPIAIENGEDFIVRETLPALIEKWRNPVAGRHQAVPMMD